MLCDKCKKRTATTHIHTNIGGVSEEMNLCSYCASVMGYGSVFGGLVGSLLEEEQADARKKESPRCPCCGASFPEIAAAGKAGCAQCYAFFGSQLAPSLQRMHGRTRHVGKVPPAFQPEDEKNGRLARLKEELSAAVRSEEFEKAAGIRDEIRALEGGSEA